MKYCPCQALSRLLASRMQTRIFCCLFVFLGLVTANVRAGEWQTDYDKALATAKAENKRVLLDFTGSDWCGPCIALKKRVFTQAEFTDYADKNLVLVEIDYPNKKVLSDEVKLQNERLKKQYGIEDKGFPTIIVLGSDGKNLGEISGYRGEGPAEFIAKVDKMKGS
jgi:thioredoxin-related protein